MTEVMQNKGYDIRKSAEKCNCGNEANCIDSCRLCEKPLCLYCFNWSDVDVDGIVVKIVTCSEHDAMMQKLRVIEGRYEEIAQIVLTTVREMVKMRIK